MKSKTPVKISVVIPNYNGSKTLKRCLEAVSLSLYRDYECIVVDDGSTDDSIEIARGLTTRIIEIEGGPLGPANARNLGAREACGDIIFFIDADVVVRPDTLQQVADSFAGAADVAGVFGSYDDQPGDGHFLSQYKNLFHHFVHQQANGKSGTFWSGCGAIRKDVFLESGGFDTLKYPHPSIEDIELGRRLILNGHQILINKAIQVKHLKQWTLTSLIKTDVFDRGIPWTQLVFDDRKIPNELNLESSQRWSALVIAVLLMFMTASAFFHRQAVLLPILMCLFWFMLQCWQWRERLDRFEIGWHSLLWMSLPIALFAGVSFRLNMAYYFPPILILLGIVVAGPWLAKRGQFWRQAIFSLMMLIISFVALQIIISYPLWLIVLVFVILGIFVLLNRRFYAFFKKKRGVMFALAVMPFHMLYFLYSMVAFTLGAITYYWKYSKTFFSQQAGSKT